LLLCRSLLHLFFSGQLSFKSGLGNSFLLV
jgi:hypothetical protein